MDYAGLVSLFSFVQHQSYLIIFLIMVFDGPIITYLAAFAASLGLFNIYLIFILSLLGNITGDILYYLLGRFGRMAFKKRYKKYFDNEKLKSHLKNHTGKALAIVKIVPPLPLPGLLLAGALKVPFKKFLFYSFIISFPISLFFTLFGFYSGIGFSTIAKYFQIQGIIIFIVVALIILWFVFAKLPKYLAKKYENIK